MTKTDPEEEDTLAGAMAFLLLFLLAFIVYAAVCGCEAPSQPKPELTTHPAVAAPHVEEVVVPRYVVADFAVSVGSLLFQKTWMVQLSQGRLLVAESSMDPRYHNDPTEDFPDYIEWTLKQPSGASIEFDCANIADKIIDAKLVSEITPYCRVLPNVIEGYWKSVHYAPAQVTDSRGNVWVRKVKP